MNIRQITKTNFFKFSLVLISGTAIAQIISFVVAPVLSRIYSPGEFALFAVFSSAVSILGVIATLRYELAIPLPASDDDATDLLRLSWKVSAVVALLSLLGVVIWWAMSTYTTTPFAKIYLLIPLLVLITGITNALNYYSIRHKSFNYNAAARVATSITTALVSLLLGYLCWGSKGLVLGFVAGQVLGMGVLFYFAAPGISKCVRGNGQSLRAMASKYKNMAQYNAPHAFIDSLQDNGIVFLLIYFFADTVTGCYALAFRILKVPVSLIGAAFYQVYYQQMSQMHNEHKDMRPFVLTTYKYLALCAIPVFAVLYFFAPSIFVFVFGSEWKLAGEIASILAPWLCLNFIASPVSGIVLIKYRQKMSFLITLVDICLRLALVLYAGSTGNYMFAFKGISIVCSLIMIFALWWFYTLANNSDE